MKKFLAFVVALVALILWLYWEGQQPTPSVESLSAPSQTTAAGPGAPMAPQGSASVPGNPAPPVPASVGIQPVQPQPPSKPSPEMEAIAQREGVKILRYSSQGATAKMTVEWSSDVMTQGMDFVEALRRAGVIRHFEADGKNLKISYTNDGRRVLRFPVTLIF